MRKLLITCLCLVFAWSAAHAQDRVTLSGTIKDASSGEDLIGATVSVKELPGTGAVTNIYGFYSLTVPKGEYTLVYKFLGYDLSEKKLNLTADQRLNIELAPSSEVLQEVVVSSEREDENLAAPDMGLTKINPKEVELIPVLFGERDVMKTIQLLPGVQSAGEGNSGFFVRGGSSDQNLILLDEAPVYNASHLLGFFSVFNSDAIKDVQLYKGFMPAQYGGRLSSVLDMKMNEGNNKEFTGTGSVGLISSKLTLEGPFVKDKASFMLSGRRTYADLFIPLANNDALDGAQLYFYDINAKANYLISDNDRLYVSGYFGRDRFGVDGFGFNWGNATGTLRWNHVVNDKLFSNTSLIYSDYDYEIAAGGTDGISITSSIQDWNLKQDYFWYPNANNSVKFGGNLIYHTFSPTSIESDSDNNFNSSEAQDRYALDGAVYVQNDQKINDRLNLRYGFRLTAFSPTGPGTYYTYNEFEEPIDSVVLDNWQLLEDPYIGWEPRFAASYRLTDAQSLKGSYSRTYQYLHLLSNSTSSNPTDIWVPSSLQVKPQISDQVSLGYYHNFADNAYQSSVEVYYKTMQNQIDYRNSADILGGNDLEAQLAFGRGWAYGAEFYLRKSKGDFTGWISYTLAKTMRQFDDINNGDPYSATQDRRHDISIVGMYQINPKITVSANWVYYTGNAVTFPSGKYIVDGRVVNHYTERNAYRMPDYHRLDVGLNWITRKTEKWESSWNFSCYNAYGRENAYTITFEPSEDEPGVTEAVQLSLFRWVPSVSYTFKF